MIRPLCDSCFLCKFMISIHDDKPDTVGKCVECQMDDINYDSVCPNITMTDCVICKTCEYLETCLRDG